MSATVLLMTAEEYAADPSNGPPTELVQGVPVPMNLPVPRHGEICFRAGYLLQQYLDTHPVGRVVSNDSGVVTERDPDTVRGPDVAFYSYTRVPKGPMPKAGYLSVVPELVIEVRSATDTWPSVLAKVSEYLTAGVAGVVVLDDQTETAHLYQPKDAPQQASGDKVLTPPAPLAGWQVAARRFFE